MIFCSNKECPQRRKCERANKNAIEDSTNINMAEYSFVYYPASGTVECSHFVRRANKIRKVVHNFSGRLKFYPNGDPILIETGMLTETRIDLIEAIMSKFYTGDIVKIEIIDMDTHGTLLHLEDMLLIDENRSTATSNFVVGGTDVKRKMQDFYDARCRNIQVMIQKTIEEAEPIETTWGEYNPFF